MDKNFCGETVLVRVDFNVPLNENCEITDDSRIQSSLPTINKLINDGAKVILISHLGRPNKKEAKFSLIHLLNNLKKNLRTNVFFSKDCIGSNVLSKVKDLQNGEILLLENLRFYKEEQSGSRSFSKQLANLANYYVNDAFGTAHRSHSSTFLVPQFFENKKFLGLLLQKEVDSLKTVLSSPKKPFTAIIGGAKISSKIDVLFSLINKVDSLIIGGGMVYTFIKSMGGNIGSSLVEEDKLGVALEIIEKAKSLGVKLLLPIDSINAKEFNNDSDIELSDIRSINSNYMGLDIGKETVDLFSKEIKRSKTIIWNGPMGVFEMNNFQNGTKKIGEAVADATKSGAFSLVGGGDSAAAIKMFNLESKISYLSTGGGALLESLKGDDLPAIKALS